METVSTMNISRKVYNALGDELSKYIFKERLLYSYTNEAEHIKNVINTIINTVDDGRRFNNILSEGGGRTSIYFWRW